MNRAENRRFLRNVEYFGLKIYTKSYPQSKIRSLLLKAPLAPICHLICHLIGKIANAKFRESP